MLLLMEPLNIKRISLQDKPLDQFYYRPKAFPKKKRRKFLKGPIPWYWLSRAAQQPGKALHIGIAIWFLAGVKCKQTVHLSNIFVKDLGVKRNAKYDALRTLESAGLISVERHRGRSPVVTILEVEQ
jgi:hypothetical protein